MHGAGNDYIYVNSMLHDISDPAQAAVMMSDRHKGIGSDGLVLIGISPVPEADFSMRIFNADGSEAMMCGNASRCIGKYLYERGLTDKLEIRLLTLSGVKTLLLHVDDGIVVPGHAHARLGRHGGDRSGFQVLLIGQLQEAVDVFGCECHGHSLLRFADCELSAIKAFVFLWDGIEVDR